VKINFPFSILKSQFPTRSRELERLDTGDYTPAEYKRWQKEMRLIHGVFGEVRALENTLVREIASRGRREVSILDVGAGSGDLLAKIARRLPRQRTTLIASDLDVNALRPAGGGAHRVRSDGTRLPFADNSVDHAISTLTLHHLNDADAVELLSEMARVSRASIFVVDLNRDPKAYYMYRLFSPLFFQKMTQEDGALSILRSRTPDELRDLAKRAGLSNVVVTASRVNRLVLSGTKG
jgi:ubiquinone/menaquinone biosynthesis C-methylase UbiE